MRSKALVCFSSPRLMRARPIKNSSHNPGRARVTEPTKTAAERRKKMSGIETRVDAKLVDLSKREMALA